jgi:hypothetical protein
MSTGGPDTRCRKNRSAVGASSFPGQRRASAYRVRKVADRGFGSAPNLRAARTALNLRMFYERPPCSGSHPSAAYGGGPPSGRRDSGWDEFARKRNGPDRNKKP